MSDPKQLKFSFLVDEASLQKARQFIRELTADLTKLNEAAGKLGGIIGGAAGGAGGVNVNAGGAKSAEQQKVLAKTAPAGRGLVQNLLDQKNVFKDIASGSKDSMRAMTDTLKQAIGAQKKELKDLDDQAAKLTKQYDALGKAIKGVGGTWDAGGATRFAGKQAVVGVQNEHVNLQRLAAHGRLQDLEAQGRAAGILPPPIPKNRVMQVTDDMIIKDRFFGHGGGIWDSQKGIMANLFGRRGNGQDLEAPKGFGGPNGWLKAGARIGGIGLAGANTILGEVTAENSQMNNAETRRAALVEGQMKRILGGDIKGIMAMQGMDATKRAEMLSDSVGGIGTANVIKDGIISTGKAVVGIGNSGGANVGPGGIMGAWSDTAMETAKAERASRFAANAEMARFWDNIATDKFSNELSQRISFQRMTGTGGLGAMMSRPDGSKYRANTYSQMEQKLIGAGYSPSEYAAATSQLRGSAGSRFAGNNAWTAMAANAEGMGGFAELMGASARSGGGMGFSFGALGGGIDRWAGVHLGQSIIGSGFDPRGTTSGLGVLAAAQNGMGFTGGATDFNLVQRLALGLQGADSITTGSMDPYQSGRNLVGAVNRLGPGASTYTQDFLASGLSTKQMIDLASGAAKGTDLESVTRGYLGNDYQGLVRGQLGESVTSVLDRFVDQGGNDRLTTAIRKFRGSGSSDISAFVKTLGSEDRAMLGDFYGRETGVGLEGGMGLMGLLSGLDTDPSRIKKGFVGKGVTGAEKDALESQSQNVKQVNDTIFALTDKFIEAYKQAPESLKSLRQVGENITSGAENFVKALGVATEAVDKFVAKMEGKDPETVARQKKIREAREEYDYKVKTGQIMAPGPKF